MHQLMTEFGIIVTALTGLIGLLAYGIGKGRAEAAKTRAEADKANADADRVRAETKHLVKSMWKTTQEAATAAKQLEPNHGSSLYDAVHRIEDKVNDLGHKVQVVTADVLESRFDRAELRRRVSALESNTTLTILTRGETSPDNTTQQNK